MKKVTFLIITLLVGSVAMFSFKKADVSTRYGGTASVRINLIEVQSNTGERKTLSSPSLNVSTTCMHYDKEGAKSSLLSKLESEANNKLAGIKYKVFYKNEWEYAGEVDYRIISCD
jgi:hypothetical protein